MPATAATTDLRHKLSQSDGVCARDLDTNELTHLVMLLRMVPDTLEITCDLNARHGSVDGWISAYPDAHQDWHLKINPEELVQWWRVRIKPE